MKKNLTKKPIHNDLSLTWISWLNQPGIRDEDFNKISKLASYLLIGFAFVWLILFLLLGYMNRPILLDDKIIHKLCNTNAIKTLINPEITNYNSSNILYNKESTTFVNYKESEIPYIYFHIEPHQITGLFIPMQYINLNKIVDRVGLSFGIKYDNDLTIAWGFLDEKSLTGRLQGVSIDLSKNTDPSRYLLSPPSISTSDQFITSWDHADYLFIFFSSQLESKVLLNQIILLGYHR